MRILFAAVLSILTGSVLLCAQTNSTALLKAKPGATNEPTVVTSDRLQVDYAHNVGTFEGNVLAIDPRITVRADKVVAFFGSGSNATRQVQRMLAEGRVVISQDDRKATADQAEFLATEGKVTLSGNPRVETPQGAISGQRITFWQGQEKMDVDSQGGETNRPRLIFYPEEQRHKTE